jgi:hypothetical protein
MVTIKPRTLALICAVCLAVGWWHSSPPKPAPLADRPFLKALARLAKTGLWIMLAAEQPPQDDGQPAQFVHARARPDDVRTVRHGEGW